MSSRASSEWPSWLLPAFLAAHALATAALIPALGVESSLYRAIPWVFGASFLLSLLPPLAMRLRSEAMAWRLAPVVLYAAMISLASSVSPRLATSYSVSWFHALEYAGLTLLAQLAAHRNPRVPLAARRLGGVLLAAVAFGALDELHQSFVPGRIASFRDLGLDALGALVGTVLFLVGRSWLRRRAGDSQS
ncbi:MAG: VanZ family protein [Polyangia bacterium]|jgi:VanZ family protein|nr:VanZ family protein [Polyangia bacterium]